MRGKANDEPRGGKPLVRGALYLLLQNRPYHGEVSHKGTVYAGEHPAIIEPALWDAVQEQLADHRANRPDRLNANMSSLLTGLVYDETDDRVVPTHAAKGVKRYRYYVSARLITGSRAEAPDGVRVPAAAVETGVIDCIRRFLANGSSVFEALQPLEADLARLQPMMRRAEEIADIFSATERADLAEMLRMVISRIEVRSDLMSITIQRPRLLAFLRRPDGANGATPPVSDIEGGAPMVLTVPFARRAGRDTRLLIDGPEATQADPALVRMLIRARDLRAKLMQSGEVSLTEVAEAEGISRTYLTRMARLAFLSPEITTAILDGRQPVHLTAARLFRLTDLPLDWSEQRAILGLN